VKQQVKVQSVLVTDASHIVARVIENIYFQGAAIIYENSNNSNAPSQPVVLFKMLLPPVSCHCIVSLVILFLPWLHGSKFDPELCGSNSYSLCMMVLQQYQVIIKPHSVYKLVLNNTTRSRVLLEKLGNLECHTHVKNLYKSNQVLSCVPLLLSHL
jgi:hypothetical protein